MTQDMTSLLTPLLLGPGFVKEKISTRTSTIVRLTMLDI